MVQDNIAHNTRYLATYHDRGYYTLPYSTVVLDGFSASQMNMVYLTVLYHTLLKSHTIHHAQYIDTPPP